jgi:hypothetical protein
MNNPDHEHIAEQEEAAQGHDLFRAPGEALFHEQERDQAEASGWVDAAGISWSSEETQENVARRRKDLYAVMRRLEAAVARPSGLADWRIEIEAALAELERSLEGHTAELEGADGLFAEVLDRAPQLDPVIGGLRREHRDLAELCHQALSMAADWSPQRLRRKVNVLLVRLALHRQSGAELLFDAYNVDIAAGD